MTNWREIARCFSVLRPVRWIDRKALDYLEALDKDRSVIVACSGGADSVFLVLAMVDLLGPERLRIAHFNHGLRGAESDGDAAFVAELAKSLNLPFELGKLDGVADKSEAALREARYKWLTGLSGKEETAIMLLGHHADDVLETQLMALFSGAGPAGLCSPMPVRCFSDKQVRVRPLLPMKRSTIEKTLTSLGASWREDSSNDDSSYTRNWLRKELLPKIAERFPQDIYSGSERTRKLMQESLDTIDQNINDLGLDLSDSRGFEVGLLKGSSKGTIRRVLLAWWMRHFSDYLLSTGANDNVVEMIQCGFPDNPVSIGVIPSLGGSAQALIINSSGRLILQNEKPEKSAAWTCGCHWFWQAGPLLLPGGGRLTGESVILESTNVLYKRADPEKEAWLTGVDGPLWVRQWQPGDRYQPLGSPGSRKLQDVFGDAKLNSEQKEALPVILNSKGEILWVPGFPPAEDAKVREGINSALRLTYWVH